MKILFILFLVILFMAKRAYSQDKARYNFTIVVDCKTELQKSDRLYIAGNFNDWQPDKTQLNFDQHLQAFVVVLSATLPLEFKITRGSWATVACTEDGNNLPNYVIKETSSNDYPVEVIAWKDRTTPKEQLHSFSKNVFHFPGLFTVPYTNLKRGVWIYLPKDYQTSIKRYPVIYMQDGQNLFDEAASYAGEWGIDESLDSMIAKGMPPAIVVGIENSELRIREYNPYDHAKYGKGLGDQYLEFLIHTVKRFIDSAYRTLPNANHTTIAGSSLGGLISYYGALTHPEVFSNAGVFSPSLWIAPGIDTLTKQQGKKVHGKYFFYMGEQEGTSDVELMKTNVELLAKESADWIYQETEEEGTHSEKYWRKVFPKFYKWIIENKVIPPSPGN